MAVYRESASLWKRNSRTKMSCCLVSGGRERGEGRGEGEREEEGVEGREGSHRSGRERSGTQERDEGERRETT
jgi:hypothetical protein